MSDQNAARASGPPAAVPSTPPAEEWQANWARTLPKLEQISRQLQPVVQHADVSIMRSSQLDAARLDDELTSMLREQFLAAFSLFRPAAIARLHPELTLLLDLLIFRFSVWEGRPLPGMALMNLRYRNEAAVQRQRQLAASSSSAAAAAQAGGGEGGGGLVAAALAAGSAASGLGSSGSGSSDSSGSCIGSGSSAQQLLGGHSGVEGPGLSRRQRGLYLAGAVLLRYAWARLTHHAASQHWGDTSGSTRSSGSRGSSGSSSGSSSWRLRCWVLMRQAESAYRLASLLNFLAFLRSGRYRSLLERLLHARLVYQQPSAARAISFEYLNRQLVWSELSELLLFLLPLVNVKAIKHALRSYLPRLPILSAAAGGSAAAAAAAGAAGGGSSQQGARELQAQQPCPICNTTEILAPWAARPCGHLFCYYCLRSHCLADQQYSCPLCLRRVGAMQPWVPRLGAAGSEAQGGGSSGSGEGDGGS